MSQDSPEHRSIRPPHPLTVALIERLHERPGAHVLDFGTGSGRNTFALRKAGFAVTPVVDGATPATLEAAAENDRPFAAAISTHALLHGTPNDIRTALDTLAELLEPGAPLYATFGSVRDARFGQGARIDERTFAPTAGDEAGVAHAFFDELELRGLLSTRFAIDAIDERDVDAIAGSWAHRERPLEESVHWFVIAIRH